MTCVLRERVTRACKLQNGADAINVWPMMALTSKRLDLTQTHCILYSRYVFHNCAQKQTFCTHRIYSATNIIHICINRINYRNYLKFQMYPDMLRGTNWIGCAKTKKKKKVGPPINFRPIAGCQRQSSIKLHSIHIVQRLGHNGTVEREWKPVVVTSKVHSIYGYLVSVQLPGDGYHKWLGGLKW